MPLAHFLFYLLLQGMSFSGVHAAAINSTPAARALNVSLSLPARDSGINNPCSAPSSSSNQRSVFNIVWSCLVTIFLCTWSSVHIDIPKDDQSDWSILCHRLRMMFSTIIFPELVIAHAVRQVRAARRLFREHNLWGLDSGWTMKHAHFERMGGFRYVDLRCLTSQHITAAEIQDKSKADGLSKIILATQSLWFVVQCIGRRVKGLYLSPLEVTTLALTVCTFMLSIIWWNKPFDVRKPIRLNGGLRDAPLRRRSTVLDPGSSTRQVDEEDITASGFPYFINDEIRDAIEDEIEKIETPPSYPDWPSEEDITEGGCAHTTSSEADSLGTSHELSEYGLGCGPRRIENPIPGAKPHVPWTRNNPIRLSRNKRVFLAVSHAATKAFEPFEEVLIFVYAAMRRKRTSITRAVTKGLLFCRKKGVLTAIGRVVSGASGLLNRISGFGLILEDYQDIIALNLPCSHATLLQELSIPVIGGTIFGLVHCISWNSYFPSATERTLWRISSVAVSALMFAAVNCTYWLSFNNYRERFGKHNSVKVIRVLAAWYIIARCYLLTEGLLAFRDLPPSALETLNWSDFLPHMS